MAKELFSLILFILALYYLASITLMQSPLFATASTQDGENTPVAVNQSVIVAEDNQSTIVLNGSDIDGGKTPLEFILVSKPTFGNLSAITIRSII